MSGQASTDDNRFDVERSESDSARAESSGGMLGLNYPQPQFADADDIATRFSSLQALPESPQPVFASAMGRRVKHDSQTYLYFAKKHQFFWRKGYKTASLKPLCSP